MKTAQDDQLTEGRTTVESTEDRYGTGPAGSWAGGAGGFPQAWPSKPVR